MRKYSKKSQETVEAAMHRMKKGKLRSSGGEKVTNPRQAVAIGLSEARSKGEMVPPKEKRGRPEKKSKRKETA